MAFLFYLLGLLGRVYERRIRFIGSKRTSYRSSKFRFVVGYPRGSNLINFLWNFSNTTGTFELKAGEINTHRTLSQTKCLIERYVGGPSVAQFSLVSSKSAPDFFLVFISLGTSQRMVTKTRNLATLGGSLSSETIDD